MALHTGPTAPEGDGKAAQAAETKEQAKATVDGVMDEVELGQEKKEILRDLGTLTVAVSNWASEGLIPTDDYSGWLINTKLFIDGDISREELDLRFDHIALDASEAREAREAAKKPADAAPEAAKRPATGREDYEENIGDYYQMKPEGIVITIDKVNDPNAYRYSTLAGIIGPQGQEQVPEGKTLALFIDDEFVPLTYVEAENDWKLDGAHKNVGEVGREKYYFVDVKPAVVDGDGVDSPVDDVDGGDVDTPVDPDVFEDADTDALDNDVTPSPGEIIDEIADSPEVVTRKSIEAIGEHLGLDYDKVKGLIQDDLASLGLPADTPISDPHFSVGLGMAILSYQAGGKEVAHVGRVKNAEKVAKDYDKADEKAVKRLIRRWKRLEDTAIDGAEANDMAMARFDEMGDYSAPDYDGDVQADVVGAGDQMEVAGDDINAMSLNFATWSRKFARTSERVRVSSNTDNNALMSDMAEHNVLAKDSGANVIVYVEGKEVAQYPKDQVAELHFHDHEGAIVLRAELKGDKKEEVTTLVTPEARAA